MNTGIQRKARRSFCLLVILMLLLPPPLCLPLAVIVFAGWCCYFCLTQAQNMLTLGTKKSVWLAVRVLSTVALGITYCVMICFPRAG